jgi:uncharacterized ubiquitin-like protein YukD
LEDRGSRRRRGKSRFGFCEGIYLIMGEEAEAAVDASSRSVTVHVRCSNGNKFSLPVDLTSTVRDLKVLLVERSEIPADQQRLIYKGRVLKDDSTLESYGVISCRYSLRLMSCILLVFIVVLFAPWVDFG